MKRITITLLSVLLSFSATFAGGIVTNTNLSAAWVRTLVRDASTDIDAAFYNPAGLTQLEDGFYVQLSSQTIFQTRTITNDYSGLNNSEYLGDTFVPSFPTIYLGYKKGKFAVSGAVIAIGGGGSAEFKTGLPSFEKGIADLVPALASSGVTAYSADIYFKGSSAYLGFQLNVSYQVADWLSLGVGGRYVTIMNSSVGHIKDIKVTTASGDVLATDFFTSLATMASGAATIATDAAAGMQPLLDSGAGGMTFAEAEAAGVITATQRTQMEGGLLQLGASSGMTQAQIDAMNLATAQGTYSAYATAYTTAAAQATGGAAQTKDAEVDVTQSGSGFAPIFSAYMELMDGKMGIALKYEMKTAMETTNETTIDQTGMFPDKFVAPAEVPAMFSLGVRYDFSEKFRTNVGFHYYFDGAAKYAKVNDDGEFVTNDTEVTQPDGSKAPLLAGNSYEIGLAMEYDMNDKMVLSGGFLYASTNPSLAYQTDMGYTLSSSTVGLGLGYQATERLFLDFGFSYTFYGERTKEFTNALGKNTDTYGKNATIIAIGLTYRMGGE